MAAARESSGKRSEGSQLLNDKVFMVGTTIMISTKHPTAPNPEGDAYWKRLGKDCATFANG